MTVVIENLKMINFKLRTCRFVDQTYEKAIVFFSISRRKILVEFSRKITLTMHAVKFQIFEYLNQIMILWNSLAT